MKNENAKHTPGPWIIGDGNRIIKYDKRTSEGFEVIAEWYGVKGPKNARLIAAAPEMLSALKIAAGCITGKAINDGRLDIVVDAIAKAEGK